MIAPLAGLRIVEVSAFVAAPLGGMTLAQLGADVIRIDPIGGNIDARRWPLTPDGESIYWASLNKGKRSVTLALNTPEGQAIATDLICGGPGRGRADGGIVLTNLPAHGWLDHATLSRRRPDLVMAQLTGNHDGTSAVDYTVNCASGFPIATGADTTPVNHVLPAWDVAAGLYLATGLLAAERVRLQTGRGTHLTLALSDVMLATVANLGYIGDVQVNGSVRPPIGNALYGAFGRDFPTGDGRRVMIVAISPRQWRAIGTATGLADRFAMIGPMLDVDLSTEGGLYAARDAIAAVLGPWIAARTLDDVEAAFAGTGVLWGPYRDFGQLVAEDARCSTANPLFETVDQAGIGAILSARSPLMFAGPVEAPSTTPAARAAPRLGDDTAAVLAAELGLDAAEFGALAARGIVSTGAG